MGRAVFPPLLFNLRPNYCRDNEGNGDLLQKYLCTHCCIQCLRPCSRPLWETPGHSKASLAQSFVGTLFPSPGSRCAHGFVCALQEPVSPVLWKFCNQIPLAYRVKFPGSSQSLCPIPRLAEFDIKFLVYIWQLDEYHMELFHSFEFILMCMLKKCLKSRNLSGLYWQLPRGKLRAIPSIAFGSLNGRDT